MKTDRYVFRLMVDARTHGYPGAQANVEVPEGDVLAIVTAKAMTRAGALAFARTLERRLGLERYQVGSYRSEGDLHDNPTLYHHRREVIGAAAGAPYHVTNSARTFAIADLYVPTDRLAKAVAEAIAEVLGFPVALLLNHDKHPKRLADHQRMNPADRPVVGEVWRNRAGDNCVVKAVRGVMVEYLNRSNGNRYSSTVDEFKATHRPPVARRPNPRTRRRPNPCHKRRHNPGCPCDGKCCASRGGVCECRCRGRNHGSSGGGYRPLFANPGVTAEKERELVVRLLAQLGFVSLARDVMDLKNTPREALEWLLSPGNRLLPESRKMIVRAALGALTTGQGMTRGELDEFKRGARAQASRERRPNPSRSIAARYTRHYQRGRRNRKQRRAQAIYRAGRDPARLRNEIARHDVRRILATGSSRARKNPGGPDAGYYHGGHLAADGMVEMTRAQYAKVHRDHKGKIEGQPTITGRQAGELGGGTALYFVRFVSKANPRHNPTEYAFAGTIRQLEHEQAPEPARLELVKSPRVRVRAARATRTPRAPREPKQRLEYGMAVRAPYSGPAKAFGRTITKTREGGTVVGLEDRNGEPWVRVHVKRGRSFTENWFPARLVRKRATTIRKPWRSLSSKHPRLWAAIKREGGGDPARIRALLDAAVAEQAEVMERAQDLAPGRRSHEGADAFRRAYNDYTKARRRVEMLELLLREVDPQVTSFEPWAGMEPYQRDPLMDPPLAASNPRRRNPRNSDELERAMDTFEMWHEFPAEMLTPVKVPSRRMPKHLVALGKVKRIDYESNKWEGRPVDYTHKTKRPFPILATDPEARALYLVGGKMKPTADGLVN